MRYGKKGAVTQPPSGSQAAVLILIITLLIVLYVVFLPGKERSELFGDDPGEGEGEGEFDPNYERLVLDERVGRLDYLKFKEYEHTVPSVFVTTRTEANSLKEFNSVYVKNGVFDQKFANLSFAIDDPENTDNVLLSFVVKRARGILTIKLNGYTLLSNELTSANPAPISLPKEYLQRNNVLEFTVDSVGWKFWKTNEYQLENIKVTGDITDLSRQEARNIFLVSATEQYNMDKATLRFSADCSSGQVGVLHAYINNHEVFSGVPDCGASRPIEFSPAYVDAGENSIRFRTERGSYLIDQIKITTNLKELRYPLFYFSLSTEEFEDIRDGFLDVNMTLEFPDDDQDHAARISVNGRLFYIDTRDPFYERSISSYIDRQENNWIKIEPDGMNLDVPRMVVFVYNDE